jgi:hypothetical protein
MYIDSEIESVVKNSPAESLFLVLKLRLLDEQGTK